MRVVYYCIMRILILGDSPLDNRLVRAFSAATHNVVQLHDNHVRSGDVLPVFAEYRPHVVINGAHLPSDDPSSFVANSKDPAVMALYARMVGARFYHLSDSSVFSTDMPRDDEDPYPTRVYGLSRLIGERAVMRLHPKATIIRTSWLYGPEMPESPPMIAWAASCGLKQRAHIYDDLQVSPTFLGDAAQLIVFNVASSHTSGIFHLAPEEPVSWFDLLKDEFPEILPLKSQRMKLLQDVHMNVSVTPSRRWTLGSSGLASFMEEVRNGDTSQGSAASK